MEQRSDAKFATRAQCKVLSRADAAPVLVDLSTMAAPNDSGQTRVAYSRSKRVFWWSSWCTCATASYQNNTHSFLRDHRCETLAQREHKWSTVSHRAWLGTATARVAVGWGTHLPCQRRDRCSAHSQRTALRPEPAAELSALHARDPAHSTRQHRSAAGGVRSAASRRARSRTAACLCSIAVVRCRKSVHAARATSLMPNSIVLLEIIDAQNRVNPQTH